MDRLPAENDSITDWINAAPPFDALETNVRHLMNPDEAEDDPLNIFDRLTASDSHRVLVEPVNLLHDDDVGGIPDIFSIAASGSADDAANSITVPIDEDVSAVASRILFEGIAEENAVYQQTFDSSIDKNQPLTELATDEDDVLHASEELGLEEIDEASTSADQILNDDVSKSGKAEAAAAVKKSNSSELPAEPHVERHQQHTPLRRSQRRVERELRMSAEEIRRKNIEEEAKYLKAKQNSIDESPGVKRRPKLVQSVSVVAKEDDDDDEDNKPLSKCVVKIERITPGTTTDSITLANSSDNNSYGSVGVGEKSRIKTLNGQSESEYSADEMNADDNDNDEDYLGNEEPAYCYKCAKIGMPGKMVDCTKCKNSFHLKCENVGKFPANLATIKNWVCANCLDASSSPMPKQNRENISLKLKLKALSDSKKKSKKVKKSLDHTDGQQQAPAAIIRQGEKSNLCVVCEKNFVESDESIYCGEICIEKIVKSAYKLFKDDNHRVMVIERGGSNRILNGPVAPALKNFFAWLKKHRKFYPVLPTKSATAVSNTAAPLIAPVTTVPRTNAESNSTSSSSLSSAAAAAAAATTTTTTANVAGGSVHTPDHVRLGVRRTLRDCLINRAKEADDVLLSNEEIKRVAVDVENEMFKLYGDTGTSYKQQFKGLVVNLKDSKNRGFFRRILNGVLSPRKVASMSGQEMASKENSFWGSTNEIEEEAPAVPKADVKPKIVVDKGKLFTKTKAEADSTGDIFGLLATDTTFQHKSHLFDLNCKICTGKQSFDDVVVKKVEKSSSVPTDTPAGRESVSSELSPSHGFESSTSGEENRRKSSQTQKVKDIPRSPKPVSLMVKGATVPSRSSPTTFRSPVVEDCVWNGLLDMPGHFHFKIGLVGVSGLVDKLKRDLPNHVRIVGRIPVEAVYDYVKSMKTAPTKDVIVVRVAEPTNVSDRLQYDGLFDNMMQKNRYCVVDTSKMAKIKDFYFLPLPADQNPDPSLLPFDGQGLPVPRENLILAIVVRRRDPVIPEKPPPVPQVPESLKSKLLSSHQSQEKLIDEGSVLEQQRIKPPSDAGVKIIKFSSSDNEDDLSAIQKEVVPNDSKRITTSERFDPRLESSFDAADPAKRFKPNPIPAEIPGQAAAASTTGASGNDWMKLWSNMFSMWQSTGAVTQPNSTGGTWSNQAPPSQQPPQFPPMNMTTSTATPAMIPIPPPLPALNPPLNPRLPFPAPLPIFTSTPTPNPSAPSFAANTAHGSTSNAFGSTKGIFMHSSKMPSVPANLEDGEIDEEDDDRESSGRKLGKFSGEKKPKTGDSGDVDWRKFNLPRKFNVHSGSDSSGRRDSSHGDKDYRSKKYW